MTDRLPPLLALRAFEAAARHLSFKKAAQELHVTPAAISQQIKQLERALGHPLFVRLTRALALTPQGAAMLPKIREGFACFAEAIASSRQAPRATLTLTAPPSFASRWLVPRLPGFYAAHPDIQLRLASSSDSVDRPGEPPFKAAVRAGPLHDAEIAIRYGTGHYPGLQAELLLAPMLLPVCAPGTITAARPLRTPADLAGHTLIHDETIVPGAQRSAWDEWLAAAGNPTVDARRGLFFSNAVLAVDAALEAQGVALALQPLVEAELVAGRLIAPLPMGIPSPYAYYLVMSPASAMSPAAAAFRHWLLGETAANSSVKRAPAQVLKPPQA